MNTRNFWFLSPPRPEQRLGRYVVDAETPIVIGSPVAAGTDVDDNGQREVTLRTTAVAPLRGKHGILVYENPFGMTVQGVDPALFGQGDFDTAPAGRPCQLVSGDNIRFRLRNTTDENVQNSGRTIEGRTIVAGLGATPTLAVDSLIGPGPGSDSGLWQAADSAHAWAIVVAVYDTDELDAQLLF